MYNKTKVFIEKTKEVHKNEYDYSLSKYIKSKVDIKIICKEHGVFEQRPSNHLNGQGCPKCSSSKGEEKVRKYLKENIV